MAKASKRVNVTFPVTLLEELRTHVPRRERNEFIVEATEKLLKQIRLKKVLEDLRREPAWSDEDHPDLMTVEDVNHYVRQLRETALPRSWDEIVNEAEQSG
ncbi:MAG: hypothetical protein Fur0044_32780 [Anaerolineae bacterium]|nr:hypothetical protein [Anaerolineales bacterium]MCQ3979383.1 hypothetical protein [Anaerolineae bacterium]